MGGDRLVARNRQRGEAADRFNIYIVRSDFKQGDEKIRKFFAGNCADDHI